MLKAILLFSRISIMKLKIHLKLWHQLEFVFFFRKSALIFVFDTLISCSTEKTDSKEIQHRLIDFPANKDSTIFHNLKHSNLKKPASIAENYWNNNPNFFRHEKTEILKHGNASENKFSNRTECLVSQYHRGCSCSKFHNNFSINCSNAGLHSVPKKWTEIGDFITTLNLERNHIKEINEGDFYGVKIRRLLLANNSLADLKLLAFWGLTTSLETLDLSYNKLRLVPSESAKLLINLKTLVLTGNEIEHLGAHDIGFWKKLEVLTLDNNPILSIHSSCIAGTKTLTFLSLDNLKLANKIYDISRMETNYIKGLSFARNGISFLPSRWTKNFTSLTLLNLGHNHITDLNQEDSFYGVHHSLKNLDLHHNKLNKIPILTLRKLMNLNMLDLSGNKISRVKKRSFNESKNLHFLDLSHNRISKISKKAFVGLDSIQKLDLRNNRLITLDDRVFGWNFFSPKIVTGKQVLLSGNPWLCNCVLNWLRESIQLNKVFQSQRIRGKRGKHEGGHKYRKEIFGIENQIINVISDNPTCERPSFLKGTLISQLKQEDLSCNHDYYYYEDDEFTTEITTTLSTINLGLLTNN